MPTSLQPILPTSESCLSMSLPKVVRHLLVLGVKKIAPRQRRVLFEVDLADELRLRRPAEAVAVVECAELVKPYALHPLFWYRAPSGGLPVASTSLYHLKMKSPFGSLMYTPPGR